MQTNKRYIVYDKFGSVEFAGDFDGLKVHFDNISENTLYSYISRGKASGGRKIVLEKKEDTFSESPKGFIDQQLRKEWEEVRRPFVELSKRKREREKHDKSK